MTKSGNLPKLSELPFRESVESLGGELYSVGGAVRDYILGLESKDLDVVITGIPIDVLEEVLDEFGRVDAVGKSFGVLKFRSYQFGYEIDVTIPRTERPNGKGGHQGFDVISDHTLPLHKDLYRRDFTINAMARDVEGNIIDMFNGMDDIKRRQIRMVNPEAFHDDPLRMLRAVQFASRFDFNIEDITYKSIVKNAHRIQEISPERVLIELEKILTKGDKAFGTALLRDTGLLKKICKEDRFFMNKFSDPQRWKDVKSMGEFMFALLYQCMDNPADFFKNALKGDTHTYKEMKAYELAFSGYSQKVWRDRYRAFEMFRYSPKSVNSNILPEHMREVVIDMKAKNMPFSMKDLKVNGDDLLQSGYIGKEIGDLMMIMMIKIYAEAIPNNRTALLNYAEVYKNKPTVS
jgi:tRNA nucleotidyltransferase/poly(A) polymerase